MYVDSTFKGRTTMDQLLEVAVITGMFVLRLGVPLAITLAVGYLLRRLDAKWRAEAETQWKANTATRGDTATKAGGEFNVSVSDEAPLGSFL